MRRARISGTARRFLSRSRQSRQVGNVLLEAGWDGRVRRLSCSPLHSVYYPPERYAASRRRGAGRALQRELGAGLAAAARHRASARKRRWLRGHELPSRLPLRQQDPLPLALGQGREYSLPATVLFYAYSKLHYRTRSITMSLDFLLF